MGDGPSNLNAMKMVHFSTMAGHNHIFVPIAVYSGRVIKVHLTLGLFYNLRLCICHLLR